MKTLAQTVKINFFTTLNISKNNKLCAIFPYPILISPFLAPSSPENQHIHNDDSCENHQYSSSGGKTGLELPLKSHPQRTESCV